MTDIEPRGFDVIAMDGHLTQKTIETVREVLESPYRSRRMVNTNFELAKRHYSYMSLKKQLNSVLDRLSGHENAPVYRDEPVPLQYACDVF